MKFPEVMLTYPIINSVALSVGPIKVHWYGITYIFSFISVWVLSIMRCKESYSPIKKGQIADMIFYSSIGVIVGGRLGYMLIYNLEDFILHPWVVVRVWEGGMSFHGGLIGVIFAISMFCRSNKINTFDLLDFIVPMVPIGLGAGRIGNFINDELWGRHTSLYIGMIFPNGGPSPRYPSQLLECFLEGIILFIILWVLSKKQRPRLFISMNFLVWYGIFRFIAEFFRQPDYQIGYIFFNWITMGQLLSLPMIIIGFTGLFCIHRTKYAEGKL